MEYMLNFNSFVSNRQYWNRILFSMILVCVAIVLMNVDNLVVNYVGVATFVASIWLHIVTVMRRCLTVDMPRIFVLISFVPVIGLLFMIYLGVVRGHTKIVTDEDRRNDYWQDKLRY